MPEYVYPKNIPQAIVGTVGLLTGMWFGYGAATYIGLSNIGEALAVGICGTIAQQESIKSAKKAFPEKKESYLVIEEGQEVVGWFETVGFNTTMYGTLAATSNMSMPYPLFFTTLNTSIVSYSTIAIGKELIPAKKKGKKEDDKDEDKKGKKKKSVYDEIIDPVDDFLKKVARGLGFK